MMAEIQDLSVTDASNTGRWPENMAFSAVNDAGRADEGLLARWFQDTNGSIAASGSSNAFAVTSNRTIASLANNTVMAFTANHTITGAATLNLNGLGAKAIKRFNGNALASGDIVSGQPVAVLYKSSPDCWFMLSAAAALTGNSFSDFDENAAPGDPAANAGRLYAKDDGAGTTILAYRDSAAVESVLGGIATQAQMEAASSAIKSVAPGRQHFHPGHPKFWAIVTIAAGVPTIAASYGVQSVSVPATGKLTITFTTAFATANYCCSVTVEHPASTSSGHIGAVDTGGRATGSVTVRAMQTGASANATLADPDAYHVVGWGDFA